MIGIPCVFYEAMAAKIPVIGPGVGGVAELVLNEVVLGNLLKPMT